MPSSLQTRTHFFEVRYRLTPWWVRVVVIWLASRIVSATILLVFAHWQPNSDRIGAHPSYLAFSQLWDSVWYHVIAVNGYPSTLPLGPGGHVTENAWAFLPGYPAVVRILMVVTGLPWEPLSLVVSFAFSLATALVFYRLMGSVLPPGTALFSVVLLCVSPLSPIMQVAYAESMGSFFLVLALLLLVQRRYVLLLPVVLIMAFTRPTGLAFALAMGLHVCHRWFIRRRDGFPPAERMLAVGVTAVAAAAGLAWPLIAWAVTGSASAYTDTELAWRAGYVGYHAFVPFSGWIQGAGFWMPGPLGLVTLALLVLAFFALLFTPPVRRLGVDLRIWLGSYALYLLAVFFPQSSTFRLLMPLSPLLGALALPRSRAYRVAIVLVSIAAQWGWIYICWWVNGYDWSPP
jgi:hypothetical protein